MPDSEITASRGAMSVNDFATWAGVGRTTAWKEIREGRLRAVKVCTRTIIVFDDARHWLATRPQLGTSATGCDRRHHRAARER